MYLESFGLQSRPFEDRADPRFYVPLHEPEEALAALEYDIREGRGTVLLLGEAGVGKTQLIRVLLTRLTGTHDAVVLNRPGGGRMDLVRETAKGFGVSLPAKETEGLVLRRLERNLLRKIQSGRKPVVIIDQAENFTRDNLAQLTTLVDLEYQQRPLIGVVLSGHPRTQRILEGAEFSRLAQRFFGPRLLPALTADQTPDYIAGRLAAAGARGTEIFDQDAVRLIYESTSGVPRLINHLCDAALVTAYGARQTRINQAIAAEAVAGVLGTVHAIGVERIGARSLERRAEAIAGPAHAETITSKTQAIAAIGGSTLELDEVGQPTVCASDEALSFAAIDFRGEDISADALTLDERINRLEQLLSRADRISVTLSASYTQFAAVEKHLTVLSRSAQHLLTRLAEAVQRAEGSTGLVQARLSAPMAQLEDRVRQLESLVARSGDAAGEIDQQLRRIEKTAHQAGDVESRLKFHAQTLADHGDEVQSRLTELMTVVSSGEQVGEKLASLVTRATGIQDTAQKNIERMQAATVEAKTEAQKIQTVFLDAALRTSRKRLEEQLQAHLTRQQSAIEELIRQSEDRLGSFRQQSDAAQARIAEDESRATAMDLRINRIRDETSGLTETADALSERIADLRRSGDEFVKALSPLWDRSERITETLGDSFTRGERLQREADSLIGRLDAAQRNASALLTDIGGGVERVRSLEGLIQTAVTTMQTLGQRRDDVETANERLAHRAREADEQARRIEETLAAARQMHGEIQGAVAHLDDKIGRLDSHHAAASHVLRELARTLTDTHELFKRAEDTKKAIDYGAQQAAERVDCLIRDVWSLSSRTESSAQALSTQNTRAADLIQRVADSLAPAVKTVADIDSATQRAETQSSALHEMITRSEECSKIIDGARILHHEFKIALTETGQTAEQIRSLRDDLSAQIEPARQRTAELADGTAAAARIIETLESSKQQACREVERITSQVSHAADATTTLEPLLSVIQQRVADAGQVLETLTAAQLEAQRETDRLTAQQSSIQDVLETTEPLLVELNDRVGTVDRRTGWIQDKVEGLEKTIDDVTARPRDLVAAAQAEAAQLEKVVTAVRKVFASLSQTTLEARTYATQCKEATDSATDRIAEIDAQTQRAAATLQQWTEEAIRAQRRLEQTLTATPSIRETHPIDTIRRPRFLSGNARISREALFDESRVLPTSPGGAEDSDDQSPDMTPEPTRKRIDAAQRAEEINRLIADAKKAVDFVKT